MGVSALGQTIFDRNPAQEFLSSCRSRDRGFGPLLKDYPGNRCRYRCRFGGTYTTYETDRTNEMAAKVAKDGLAD
jgi:hypothetical protein